MKTISIITLLILFQNSSYCQDIPDKFRIYKVSIYCFDQEKKIKGAFYSFSDSSISIINSTQKGEITTGEFEIITYPVNNIRMLKIRRKGKGGTSTAIGFATGALLGGILGYSSGDWDSEQMYHPDSQAYFFGTTFGIFGAGVGAISSARSKRIKILGKVENIIRNREKFNKFSIIKNTSQSIIE